MMDAAKEFTATSPFDWGKHLPGMDFLKHLQPSAMPAAGSAASAASGLGATAGGWAVPTLNVQELEQRIKDLESVLFWLEQNVMGVKTTIQALQVQKMTLSTLQGMNVNFQDLAAQLHQGMSAAVQPRAAQTMQAPQASSDQETTPKADANNDADPAPDDASPINPTLWWNALTEQFQKVCEQAASPNFAASVDKPKRSKTATSAKQTKSRLTKTTVSAKASGRQAASVKSAVKKSPAKRTATGTTRQKPTKL